MDLKALFKLSYGMYIVTSVNREKKCGQIANTVFQVTSDPPQVAVCINKQNETHGAISASGKFCLSVLSETAPMTLIGRFGFKSGRDTDKFGPTEHTAGANGCPVVTEHSIACFEASVNMTADSGTHTLFVGEVTEAKTLYEGAPMTYAYYHEIKGGKSPKTAPTYIKEK